MYQLELKSNAQKGGQVCTSALRKTSRLLHKSHEKKKKNMTKVNTDVAVTGSWESCSS